MGKRKDLSEFDEEPNLFIKSGPRKEQGHGQPRLIDGRDPTDELLLLRLLKKLMQVLIERCQNTQCMKGQGCFVSK
ncbi:hypothetical protein QTP70_023829, partial [Hemibagrus guttatus]